MQEYCQQNKRAWDFDAYNFWVSSSGKPIDRAKEGLENPVRMLKRYADYLILTWV